MSCPCGLGPDYAGCCGRYHAGEAAPTAERLMRARYSAFAVHDDAYLLATWHPDGRPRRLRLRDRWLGLEVVATSGGGLLDTEGTVEFRATHESGVVHEVSRFVRLDGRWVYVGPAPG